MSILKTAGGILLSIFLFAGIAVTSIIFFTISLAIWIFTFPFDKNRKILHLFACYGMALWAYIMPTWKIRVEGREKMRKDAVYVIVANHQSQLDILVSALLYRNFKWISKAEILRIPFIGWQMALNKYIIIRRGFVNSISKMMTDCVNALNMGSSILIFPEGTRSRNGEIQEFKSGAFILAAEQKAPILPVVIYGTKDAMSPKSLLSLSIHRIYMKVLDEVPYNEYSKFSPEENRKNFKSLIEKHYKLIEKRIELGLYK